MIALDLPSNNLAEITLLGTGGGYGESSVVHLGNQNWAIVDSCINPITKESLPLVYLKEIGVDVERNVRLIVCTHWHDDHIRGLSKLLEECKNAKFSFARATDKEKFLKFISLDYEKLNRESNNSSTVEFNNCLDIIIKRKSVSVFAGKDRTLLRIPINGTIESEIFSLSPSDLVMEKFDRELSQMMVEFVNAARKVEELSPNYKSIALFIKFGDHRAILGADLEVSTEENEGWLDIINSSQVIDKKSTLFKIPHHGSKNGFDEKIWDTLLEEKPVGNITPWNKNQKLPEVEMLNKYCALSDKIYMTSRVVSSKGKKRDKDIEKMIEKFNCRVSEIKYKRGIIRCRCDIYQSNAKWDIELFGEAWHINKEINP